MSKWKKLKHFIYGTRMNLIVLGILIMLIGAGQTIIRNTLMENAYETGTALARNYASEEDGNLSIYERMLFFGSTTLDEMMKQGETEEDIYKWMDTYFLRMHNMFGEKGVTPYFIYNGEYVSSEGKIEGVGKQARKNKWYNDVMSNDGEVVFTDIYSDLLTGDPVITIAKKCEESENVIGFDIFPSSFRFQFDPLELSFEDSFFLCDRQGNLIYKQTDLVVSDQKLETYVSGLVDKINHGELETYEDSITDLDGNEKAVYYTYLDNGWISIVTIPYSNILKNLGRFNTVFIAIFVVFLGVFLVMTLQDYWQNSRIKSTNETVRVLGNSYYALYRVDFINNTYEMIKGSDYIRDRLKPKGQYDKLLAVTSEVIAPDAYQEYIRSFSADNIKSLVARRVRDFGGDFQRKFGNEYRWVSVRMLFDESLDPEEVVLCYREVEKEKQKQLQEQKLLENALALAKKNETAKQNFFSNMSHDMRTPLNAIIGLSELADQSCEDPEKTREYIRKISFSSRQLLNLINDILDMSRMQQGRVVLNNQKFNLKDCVEDCLEPFRMQAESERKNLKVEMYVDNNLLMGDPFRITQILNNILSNAFKFTSEGDEISLVINQLSRGEYPKYKFVIRDTGIGMSKSYLPHLFEPYSREKKFSSQQAMGTGLGMSITKNLITQMDGEIHVESEEDKGTMFIIVLPFASAEEESTGEQKQMVEEYPITGMNILLAEDNAINMEITTELLKMNGAVVTQAWNGKEAVSLFKESIPFAYDMILMDMQMPEMDGCEATRIIRSMYRPDSKKIPIVAVTANAFAEDIAVTTAAGMDAHISKPIDFKMLCRTIYQLWNR